MIRPRRLFLVYFLLLICWAWAEPMSTPDGVVKLTSGEVYGAPELQWEQDISPLRSSYRATLEGKQVAVILDLAKVSDLEGPGAIELFKEELGKELNRDLSALELKQALSAPYPWPQSKELRLLLPPTQEKACAYLATGSGRTLILCCLGRDSEERANSMAASFKENFQLRREWQARHGHSRVIAGPLVTGATFFMILAILTPIGVTIFYNRRHSKKHNPYHSGLAGLGVGMLIALTFGYLLLGRFSGIAAHDYVRVFGGVVSRAVFLGLITGYLSKRWSAEDVPASE